MAANTYVNFTPYDEQMAELQRRQKLADLMQQQAVQPLETPQSGGRMIAKVSPLAGLAKMLQAYSAGAESRNIEKQRGAAEEQARTQAMDWMKGFQPSVGVSPDAALQASMTPFDQQTNVQPQVTALTPQERQNRLYQGALSANPYTAKMAQILMSQKPAAAPIKEIEAEKFTPESLAAFQQSAISGTPNYALLKQVAPKPTAPTVHEGMQWDPQTNSWNPIPNMPAKAPTTVGGMQWDKDQNKFVPIPGYEQQQAAIQNAKRPDIPEEVVSGLAARVIAGDKAAMYGLGRNPAAVMKIQAEVTKQLKDAGAPASAIVDTQRQLNVRQKTENEFTTGKAGTNIKALNTFTQHSNHLYDMADALDRGDIAAFNKAASAFQAATNQPAPNNLQLVGQLVADELQKAALGTAGGEREREELIKRLSGTGVSGKVIKSAIDQARGLVKGQLGSLKQQWSAGYGDPNEFDQRFLTPESQAIFARPKTAGGTGRPAPKGVDPQLWAVMTPEEQAAWK